MVVKDILLWDHELWKQIAAAHQIVRVTHVKANSKGLFSDKTHQNQVAE